MQDKNPDNRAQAEAKFKDISEAYEASCSGDMGLQNMGREENK
jgi:hypothetical protein